MGKTKHKPKKNGKAKKQPLPEVMTLAEAAEWLRVSEAEMLEAARSQTIPSISIAENVRFSKAAIERLLAGSAAHPLPDDYLFKKSMSAVPSGRPRNPEEKQRLLSVIGSMADDESWEPMVEEIYRERARRIVGDAP